MSSTSNRQFAAVRKRFPHTGEFVYFNAASNGPISLPVANAIRQDLDERLSAHDKDGPAELALADDLRRSFAKLIGARVRETGVGMSTSFGLNIAAYGLPLKRGDEVLVSDIEFPASVYTWRGAARTRGLKLRFIPSKNRQFSVDNFLAMINRRTRVLAVSWVQFFNGYKNDLAVLSSVCKQHGIYLVVDGIQGIGAGPINVRKLGVDILSCGCQKWLLSPNGCGFFYLADHIRDKLVPPMTSWLDVEWRSQFQDMFSYDRPFFSSARRFELGFAAILNMLGMQAAVHMILDLGVRQIQKHNHALIDRISSYVNEGEFYRETSSMKPGERSSIYTFTCHQASQLRERLVRRKIICSYREGSIRISIHLYNNNSDVDRLLNELDDFSRSS